MSTFGMTNRLESNSFADTKPKGIAPRSMAAETLLLIVTIVLGTGIMAAWLSNLKAVSGGRKSIEDTLSATIAYAGIDRAVQQYYDLKTTQPGAYQFDEDELNSLGYQLIRADKFKKAIRIFQLNAEAYPQSSNVYDSLAEAYMDDGNQALAIANYQKSLQLNPKNRGALRMLRKLTTPGFVLRRANHGPI